MPKILIADDSRFQRHMLASFLLPKNFEIIFAVDALQTWMMALRSSPDLILLDINMPGGTGIEVLKRLRLSNKTQQIPVIWSAATRAPPQNRSRASSVRLISSTSRSTTKSSPTPSIVCSAFKPTLRSFTQLNAELSLDDSTLS